MQTESERHPEIQPVDGPSLKPPAWAFAINFFWPGAGLIYLRKPLWGALNFVVVVAIAAVVWIALPIGQREQVAPWLGLLLCGGSGFLAHKIANQANERLADGFDAAANPHEKTGG
ncbi:MAG TPA: hypothetical protein VGN42_02530 [Pirellulales bacterium]|jgi:TM2 domain-containing membrane protein YozV|nr:hypothetical protein [Pirellulales bacterium]